MAKSPRAARVWLRKARQDLESADRLLTPPPLPAAACFHAQQAVEKALKAVAVACGAETIPRTHNLLELARVIRGLGESLPYSREQLAGLAPYAVETRYPQAPEPTRRAAQAAAQLAHQVYTWAQQTVTRACTGA